LQGRSRDGGRNPARGEIDLLFGEIVEGRRRKAEVLGQQLLRGVSHPVGDAERAEFGKVAVVEHEDEVARLVAQGLEDMAVTARKIPDIAGSKIIGLGTPCGSITVVRTRPSVTKAHSAAVACQCSSRITPGSMRIETPARPLEIGSWATVASLP
jgi:hypothetical protein